jgi:conjugal transfer pilus assembly protein TraV
MSAVRLVLVITLFGLAGCSAKYGCKGLPENPACLSAVEAYRATEHMSSKNKPTESSVRVKTDGSSTATGVGPAEPAPNPRIDDPTPIRTPAQVMRIWIAPWEDAEGDLNVSGYVFTELEPRRWMIGKPAPTLNPSISPVQVLHREKEENRNSTEHRKPDGETPAPPRYGAPEDSDP